MLAAQLKASGCEMPLALLLGRAPEDGNPLEAEGPDACLKNELEVPGKLKAGMLGWGAAWALGAGRKGLAPKLSGAADAAAEEAAAPKVSTVEVPPRAVDPPLAVSVPQGAPKRDGAAVLGAELSEAAWNGKAPELGAALLIGAADAPAAGIPAIPAQHLSCTL